MEIIQAIEEMQDRSLALKRQGRRIGFVPTMGALHKGHLSLMRIAREQADLVVVSIFVNPAQFGPHEDFETYPRDFERDEALCRDEGVEILFYPTAATMYAPDHSVYLEEDALSKGVCESVRPGHFRGVLTVVAKLFNIVRPDIAVFGQKDAQQLRLIQRMVRDLNIPVEIVEASTVREQNGLAASSRNRYLSPEQCEQATCLRRALDLAETLYAEGERDAPTIKQAIIGYLSGGSGVTIEYVELVDHATLEAVREIKGNCLVDIAVLLGNTHLIDNTVLS